MTFDLANYVDVPTRIRQLKEKYPEAVLRPFNPDEPFRIVDIGGREFIVYTAACYRTPTDPMPAIACAAEPVIGSSPYTKNSELMNAETSAWGRVIMATLAVDETHVASREEVVNRRNDEQQQNNDQQFETLRQNFPDSIVTQNHPTQSSRPLSAVASEKQLYLMNKLAKERNIVDLERYSTDVVQRDVKVLASMTSKEASKVIKSLMDNLS